MSESGASFGGSPRRGAGGTSGGLGEFFGGLALVGVGAYLLLSRVTVHTSFWRMGWVLTLAGFGAIIVGVISNMDIYFQPTSLTVTLIMLGMIAAGLGLVIRSLRPHG